MNEFFKMLKEDHKTVADILDQLEDTENTKKREELFLKLKEELVPHMKAEEIAYYPPLLEKEDSKEVALEGVEEHHVSDMVFKELEKMPKNQDQWAAKLKVFKELVEHHVKEEEGPIFMVSEIVLSEAKLQSIMKQFVEEKQKIKATLK